MGTTSLNCSTDCGKSLRQSVRLEVARSTLLLPIAVNPPTGAEFDETQVSPCRWRQRASGREASRLIPKQPNND